MLRSGQSLLAEAVGRVEAGGAMGEECFSFFLGVGLFSSLFLGAWARESGRLARVGFLFCFFSAFFSAMEAKRRAHVRRVREHDVRVCGLVMPVPFSF
jgi:hypothetical protein